VEADEVDDVVIDDAIIEVADGSAEDERESNAGQIEAPAGTHQHNADHHDGDDREQDESAANQIRRGGVSKEAEGRACVEDVSDVEDSGNYRVRAAYGQPVGDEFFADVVSDSDEAENASRRGK
jgi:hypothetical protein